MTSEQWTTLIVTLLLVGITPAVTVKASSRLRAERFSESLRERVARANMVIALMQANSNLTAEATVVQGQPPAEELLASLRLEIDDLKSIMAGMDGVLEAHDAKRDRKWLPPRSDWILLVISLVASFILGWVTAKLTSS